MPLTPYQIHSTLRLSHTKAPKGVVLYFPAPVRDTEAQHPSSYPHLPQYCEAFLRHCKQQQSTHWPWPHPLELRLATVWWTASWIPFRTPTYDLSVASRILCAQRPFLLPPLKDTWFSMATQTCIKGVQAQRKLAFITHHSRLLHVTSLNSHNLTWWDFALSRGRRGSKPTQTMKD